APMVPATTPAAISTIDSPDPHGTVRSLAASSRSPRASHRCGVLSGLPQEAVFLGGEHSSAPGAHSEFAVDRADVALHGVDRDGEAVGDLLAGARRRELTEKFP